MSLEIEPPPRKVRLGSTPEYIPTLSKSIVLKTSNTKPNDSSETETKKWGKIKGVAQIQSEHANSDSEDENKPKRVGISELQRVSKLILRSKRAIERVRNKYSVVSKSLPQNKNPQPLVEVRNDVDPDLFEYNLADMHYNTRKQRHMKIAVLQQTFLHDLPIMAEMSMKQRLLRKIELLQKIKNCSEEKEEEGSDDPAILPDIPASRRQTMLRKSLDNSNINRQSMTLRSDIQKILEASEKTEKPKLPRTMSVAEIDKELALSKSRQRIEDSLNLPDDRMARFSLLKANVEKINVKFHSLLKGKKSDGDGNKADGFEEEKLYYVPSRFVSNGMVSTFAGYRSTLCIYGFVNS